MGNVARAFHFMLHLTTHLSPVRRPSSSTVSGGDSQTYLRAPSLYSDFPHPESPHAISPGHPILHSCLHAKVPSSAKLILHSLILRVRSGPCSACVRPLRAPAKKASARRAQRLARCTRRHLRSSKCGQSGRRRGAGHRAPSRQHLDPRSAQRARLDGRRIVDSCSFLNSCMKMVDPAREHFVGSSRWKPAASRSKCRRVSTAWDVAGRMAPWSTAMSGQPATHTASRPGRGSAGTPWPVGHVVFEASKGPSERPL